MIELIIVGIVNGRKGFDSLHISNVALLIAGLVTALVPLCSKEEPTKVISTYFFLAIYSAVFGLCIGE